MNNVNNMSSFMDVCHKCGTIFNTYPSFDNMNGDGSPRFSTVIFDGKKFKLCNRCTCGLYTWLSKKGE